MNRSPQSPQRKENVAEYYAAGTPHNIPQRLFEESEYNQQSTLRSALLYFSSIPCNVVSQFLGLVYPPDIKIAKHFLALRDLRVLLFKIFSFLNQCKSVKISGEVPSS